jgi:hypothetical protein
MRGPAPVGRRAEGRCTAAGGGDSISARDMYMPGLKVVAVGDVLFLYVVRLGLWAT